jgi:acetyl esterase/lipase
MQEIMNNLASFSNWLALPTNVLQYHSDINHTFVTGLSAGGHLSALVSVARFDVSNWNPAVVLRGGVDFYGITDIQGWDVISAQWLNQGGLFNQTVLSDYSIVAPFSPIIYVNSTQADKIDKNQIVPLLLFHGTVDTVVPVDQSQRFNNACDANGLKCTYIEIPKGAHVFEGKEHSAVAQITLWAMERFFQLCLAM